MVAGARLAAHHVTELLVVDAPVAVLVHLSQDLLDAAGQVASAPRSLQSSTHPQRESTWQNLGPAAVHVGLAILGRQAYNKHRPGWQVASPVALD